ncbi:hypothetical protein T4C_6561 [Trichinella pseudospiralis]|uniref:Uncharacterized protein n=1 Tax=Trichinella pseudospiralis TaxID=6337 RepID=A0A0V1JM76_TRIPS|nr:hypothetical protein T4C_6561 [Trichinella pseudospiralis]
MLKRHLSKARKIRERKKTQHSYLMLFDRSMILISLSFICVEYGNDVKMMGIQKRHLLQDNIVHLCTDTLPLCMDICFYAVISIFFKQLINIQVNETIRDHSLSLSSERIVEVVASIFSVAILLVNQWKLKSKISEKRQVYLFISICDQMILTFLNELHCCCFDEKTVVLKAEVKYCSVVVDQFFSDLDHSADDWRIFQ